MKHLLVRAEFMRSGSCMYGGVVHKGAKIRSHTVVCSTGVCTCCGLLGLSLAVIKIAALALTMCASARPYDNRISLDSQSMQHSSKFEGIYKCSDGQGSTSCTCDGVWRLSNTGLSKPEQYGMGV
jgi:hypothetical protein